MRINLTTMLLAMAGVTLRACQLLAQTPFAVTVVDFAPAPGQFVQNALFNDPYRALGPPVGGGTSAADNTSVVSLGGFGGQIVLGFDHTVMDDRANPWGVDAIVFGNAFWTTSNGSSHWAEAAVIEISRDADLNGLADDVWYLIPGSHLTDPANQVEIATWDEYFADPTYPPDNALWLLPEWTDQWTTQGFRLPAAIFDVLVLENPQGPGATLEGVYGYADYNPTLVLPVDPPQSAEAFYTVPDDPLTVGITPGSGGGDGFDIAWAVDPVTNQPAGLDGFDFIRITTGVNLIQGATGEISAEIDAVADAAQGRLGDGDYDGDVDLDDLIVLHDCRTTPESSVPQPTCRVMDFDDDGDADLYDQANWQNVFGTP